MRLSINNRILSKRVAVYWFFFKFLIETGMRKGEAAALKWSDIELKNKTVVVKKTLDFDFPEAHEEL
ncbi:tyrosine-type recombinase/integrase, partial [Paenibacillus sp. UY79]|nr:tyrosine-type recombinase/integrase [Paenibacillus farraposensis]